MIGIEWLYGEERAANAALAKLAELNVSPEAAHAAYMAQLNEDVHVPLYGDALAWIAAESAADIAATQGWDKPEGASVSIFL